ncbi:MAG TPA: chorismate mutase [Pseudobacteroides sp.]|uniref:chorismate mutase n=1 Tax=Pseudobacteroides sp. TaxID=1968840 RepID=UPI002F950B30
MVRALRGATTVKNNDSNEILEETKILLTDIVEKNNINEDDVISIIFSVTKDLNAAFPAVAARKMGWTNVALFCTNEMDVPGSLSKCIRVLLHINTEKGNKDLIHVYLNGAKILRPDLAE